MGLWWYPEGYCMISWISCRPGCIFMILKSLCDDRRYLSRCSQAVCCLLSAVCCHGDTKEDVINVINLWWSRWKIISNALNSLKCSNAWQLTFLFDKKPFNCFFIFGLCAAKVFLRSLPPQHYIICNKYFYLGNLYLEVINSHLEVSNACSPCPFYWIKTW